MDTVISTLLNLINQNKNNPKLYIFGLLFAVVFYFVFPYIDANFLFYYRMEQRVNILQALAEIDTERLLHDPILAEEYDNILYEIDKRNDLINTDVWGVSIIPNRYLLTKSIILYKFFSGASVFFLLACICLIPHAVYQRFKDSIIPFIMLFVFAIILGVIGAYIPVIITPWVNYIGYPLIQIIILLYLTSKFSDTSSNENVPQT